MAKRTLDAFFTPSPKRARTQDTHANQDHHGTSQHASYPHPINMLPDSLHKEISSLPARPGRQINDQPDLDLLFFEPFVPSYMAKQLFEFLRADLPFYRVEYDIKRGGIQTHITTPRWTTVFGLDETCFFKDGIPTDKVSGRTAQDKKYERCPPRPMPQCLDALRLSTEAATGCLFNFCLVNYYASGADSISFHSDDERFLGAEPAIASFSLGARRDFLMKHKPIASDGGGGGGGTGGAQGGEGKTTLKLGLGSGDMILMRGMTQSNWLHSIPKRTGKNQEDGGRINITFRRAMVKGGTENYYNYNVGTGPVYRWDKTSRQMELWKGSPQGENS
ncbi:hypothetical protein E4U17_000509 [Claviceps sp. LM77 group G4]|nr:hypothetical protein E4U17_000509 [Claviceps sp. LM77 group G4]KAG6052554.1 hypothetical protein E4U33_000504 [Claviceps sp. LM78 group G4]KAG6067497.1 hypothetical protein E4U16_008179 [Claviceps sp. LM84 group G4]